MKFEPRLKIANHHSADMLPAVGFALDATHLGVWPGMPHEQTLKLQRAIERAARANVPLWLPPGTYRTRQLELRSGSQIVGVRGGTCLLLSGGPSLIAASHVEAISLINLVFDGNNQPLPQNRGLIHVADARGLRMTGCTLLRARGNALTLLRCDGAVAHNTVTDAGDNGVFSNDSRGLVIVGNIIRRSGNGGIRVWQSDERPDGSMIAENIIEDTYDRDGGSGQNGNAINVFRAADVIIRGNSIRNAAFSAIRGNAASSIQMVANTCNGCDDVALYSEFAFENAVIADNVVVGAGSGISVTNFKEGGRLAIVRGNALRDLAARAKGVDPEKFGIGIGVEADTVVSGNVIDGAQTIGIRAGWGPYLRDVAITGNTLRQCGIGIGVSVVDGGGPALIANNMIGATQRGAILGMKWQKVVTGDLAMTGVKRFPQLQVDNNQSR